MRPLAAADDAALPSPLHPTTLLVFAAVAAGHASATSIARRLDLTRQQVHVHLARLVERGLLERDEGEGAWLHRLGAKSLHWEERLLVRPAALRIRVEIETP
jgi:DNA-binding IclR family transcriptional regulator